MDSEESISQRKGGQPWIIAMVVLFLGALTWFVFGQTARHDFVNFNDGDYVVKNLRVTRGLSLDGIIWAFTHAHAGNWHPLTWISHMLDCQLWGLNPGAHHLTSVVIHGITTALLFLVLRRMTGALWRSAFVAAVFAIHPLHVESVAWVAERKDTLGALFFVLILAAYVRYVRRGGLSRYMVVMAAFVLGLMCSPMLVTVPVILLLLDYFPLRCFEQKEATLGKLIIEKLPFAVVGVAACLMTLVAQRSAIQPMEKFPLPMRLGNAVITTVDYLRQTFWPFDLAVFYPWDAARINTQSVAIAAAVLVAVSVAVFVLRGRGYFVTGWFWFLVMLLPVLGIIQVGIHAHADRYTYLPQIGIVVLVTWAAADLLGRVAALRYLLAGCGALLVVALAWTARAQTAHWHDSETLWAQALSCTIDNPVAEENLGQALFYNGKVDGALMHLEKALAIEPNDAIAHAAMGAILLRSNTRDEALAHLQRSLEIYPKQPAVHSALGVALLEEGNPSESLKHLEAAIAIDPDDSDAHFNLGNTLLHLMRPKDAVAEYERAFQINPSDSEALNNMAWVLATWPEADGRDAARAVQSAEKADGLARGRNAVIIATLAAAYAEAGRFAEAISTAERGVKVATDSGDKARAEFIQVQIEVYKTNMPLRDQRFAAPPR